MEEVGKEMALMYFRTSHQLLGLFPKIIHHSMALHLYIHTLSHLPHRVRVRVRAVVGVRISVSYFMPTIMNIVRILLKFIMADMK